MTYNFDPERWYENEFSALEALHKKGDISDLAIFPTLRLIKDARIFCGVMRRWHPVWMEPINCLNEGP